MVGSSCMKRIKPYSPTEKRKEDDTCQDTRALMSLFDCLKGDKKNSRKNYRYLKIMKRYLVSRSIFKIMKRSQIMKIIDRDKNYLGPNY